MSTSNDTLPTKICSRCKAEKPATCEYFSRSKHSPDGFCLYCKPCINTCAKRISIQCPGCQQIRYALKANEKKRKTEYCKSCYKRYAAGKPFEVSTVEKDGTHKMCPQCKVVKPATRKYFWKNSRKKSGLQNQCIQCKHLYYETNKERILSYGQGYRQDHREERNTKNRRYYAAHAKELAVYRRATREQKATNGRVYRAKNRDTLREKHRRAYANNKEERRKKNRERYRANPDLFKMHNERRRARLAGAAINDLTPTQWKSILVAYGYRCVYCPEDCQQCKKRTHQLTKDHIEPIVKGGNHTVSNIVPACGECNARKYTGPPLKPVQPLLLAV